jgi:hypothetical protein
MRPPRGKRSAISSSNVITGTVVGGFVGLVIFALVWTSIMPATPQPTQLSFEGAVLFGGSLSVRSINSTCVGAAEFEVYIQNPTNNNISIVNVTISGSGVNNATALVTVSNSCLTVAESLPVISAGGDYQLNGFVNAPLRFTSTYDCMVQFSDGETLNQTLIAQS